MEYLKVSPAKAAFSPKPPGRTQVTVNEKFCRGENERGPAFWGLGGLRAEPRRPCIRAGPPQQRNPAKPLPCERDVRSERKELWLRRAQRAVRPFEDVGSRRGSWLQWCRRTAGAFPKLRWLQLSSACRTRGTPCSSAATLHLAVVFRRPCLTLVRSWQPRTPDAYPNWSPLPFSAVRRDSGPHSWACRSTAVFYGVRTLMERFHRGIGR